MEFKVSFLTVNTPKIKEQQTERKKKFWPNENVAQKKNEKLEKS